MRLAIGTDAWFPQVNGVVRTLSATVSELERRGIEVSLVTPDQFSTVPLPGYSSIRMALAPRFTSRRLLNAFQPTVAHISTEGPIGWSMRKWCLDKGVPFTTAFHTRFPDYIAVRTGIKAERIWPFMHRFHAPASAILTATASLRSELALHGLGQTREWSRGIDHSLFHPDGPAHPRLKDLPRPILLNVGRVSGEKNLEAFLSLPGAGTKVVVGDGPALPGLRQKYPHAVFFGALGGEELACAYRAADCFVFPSLTDTFGLVIIEALACGLPVAGFPVQGPIDIVGPSGRGPDGLLPCPVGALAWSLDDAIGQAIRIGRADAAAYGASFSWTRATDQFLEGVEQACARPRTGPAAIPGKRDAALFT